MYIKRIEFSNLRCFKTGEMELVYPGSQEASDSFTLENVNVILGVNGSGKTTALKAIALTLIAQLEEVSGFIPYSLVRRDATGYAEEASAYAETLFGLFEKVPTEKIPLSGLLAARLNRTFSYDRIYKGHMLDPTDTRLFEEFFSEDAPSLFMVAYGATRRTESGEFDPGSRSKSRHARYARVAGLFEDHLTLVPMQRWLEKVEKNESRFSEVIELIANLLPEGLEFRGEQERDEYVFHHHGITVAFRALSDGYRAYIGWITDLISHLVTVCPPKTKLRELEGVVLVDEIDLHVHPTWQREIVAQISRALPRLQFVFTTHSPIVAGSVASANLFIVAQPSDQDSATITRPSSEVYGLSADQILTSEMFGLNSTRAPEFVKTLEYLESKATQGDPDAAMALMRGLARGAGAAVKSSPETAKSQKATKKNAARSSSSSRKTGKRQG
jgi:energy-coupling factor transporter ATP-binding protein EcfA2